MAEAVKRDPLTASLDERQLALVSYAIKLTKTPQLVSDNDITFLRDVGFSDAAIHDVASITAYFNFVNRVATGLGVQLETT